MRKVIATLVIIAFITGIFIAACSQGEKRISLRFKYEPGLKLTYKQISKSNYKIIEADTVVKEGSREEFEVDIQMNCARFVDDSTAEVVEKGTWTFEHPNKEDTTKVDTSFRTTETVFQVLPSGKILDIQFVSERGEGSRAYVKNYYEQGVPVFPAGDKPIGYSWTQSTKVMLPDESMEASTTYTLKSEARQAGYDCAVIEYDGTMVIPVIPNPKDSVQRSGIDHIRIKGVMYFAHKEGFVVQQKESWTIDGDRQAVKGNEVSEFKMLAEYGVDFSLVKHETGR